MDFFSYRERKLFCEEVAAEELAGKHGTPLYVYSKATMVDHFKVVRLAGRAVLEPSPKDHECAER